MDWNEARKTIDGYVRAVGEANVLKMVYDASMKPRTLMEEMKLPEGFRFFTDVDWMGFSGCSRFVDGVVPIAGNVRLQVDVASLMDMANEEEELKPGDIVDCLVIVSPAEDHEKTGEKKWTDINIYIGSNDYFTRTYPTRAHALANLAILLRASQATQPLTVQEIVSIGYAQQN